MTVETSKSLNRFNAQHALVLLTGLLVFVLLVLAKKTSLEGDKDDALATAPATENTTSAPPSSNGTQDELSASLPPAAPDPSLDSLVGTLAQASAPQDRAVLFQAIVERHQNNGRLDLAALQAGVLADEQPETRNRVVAGALFRNAAFLEHVQADSVLSRKFSDQALRHLRAAEAQEPRNEDVLMELGLAMVESKDPSLSMDGILKIRTVTEINPRNTEALYQLGVFSMDTKQFDKAEGRFRQVLEVEPGNLSAQLLLAAACQQTGKAVEASKLLTALSAQTQDKAIADRALSLMNHQP